MTGARLSRISDDDLVRQYAELSAMQGRAMRLLVSSSRDEPNRRQDLRDQQRAEASARRSSHRPAEAVVSSERLGSFQRSDKHNKPRASTDTAGDADNCGFQSLPAGRAGGHVFEHVRRRRRETVAEV